MVFVLVNIDGNNGAGKSEVREHITKYGASEIEPLLDPEKGEEFRVFEEPISKLLSLDEFYDALGNKPETPIEFERAARDVRAAQLEKELVTPDFKGVAILERHHSASQYYLPSLLQMRKISLKEYTQFMAETTLIHPEIIWPNAWLWVNTYAPVCYERICGDDKRSDMEKKFNNPNYLGVLEKNLRRFYSEGIYDLYESLGLSQPYVATMNATIPIEQNPRFLVRAMDEIVTAVRYFVTAQRTEERNGSGKIYSAGGQTEGGTRKRRSARKRK
jgi:hypothetical protein